LAWESVSHFFERAGETPSSVLFFGTTAAAKVIEPTADCADEPRMNGVPVIKRIKADKNGVRKIGT
jgi:hypothetical protein